MTSKGFCVFSVAVSLAIGPVMGVTNTWDADIDMPGAQDGSGIWSADAANTNWWNGTANVPWDNAAPESAVFGAGDGAAGTITLGGPITVSNLYFHAPGSGSYVIEGNGHALTFGVAPTSSSIGDPIFWVSSGVTVTNRANSQNGTRFLDVTGGGTLVLAGTNVFRAVDIADSDLAQGGIPGVPGTTVVIPAGASLSTLGTTPVGLSAGFRLRDRAALVIDGTLETSSAIGGYTAETEYSITVNPGAVVTNRGELVLGWNSQGTLNMNGGLCVVHGRIHHMDSNDGSAVNLNNGVLEASSLMSQTGNGLFTVNFNGGTLRARGNNLLNESSDKSAATVLRVLNGGAVIDSNGYSIETAQALTRNGSGGLLKLGAGTLAFAGGTYTGATTVAAGTLHLNFNRRAASVAWGGANDFYERGSRLVLDGGHFAVTGRASVPSVTRNFTTGDLIKLMCARGNTAGLVAGMPVSGLHIPTNTYVVCIKDSSYLTLSKAAANSAIETVELAFGAVDDTTWQTVRDVELRQDATFTVSNGNGPGTTLSLCGVTGGGGLSKAGDGTLALSGVNTYGGATAVEAGVLRLTRGESFDAVPNFSFETHAAFPTNRVNWDYGPSDASWWLSGAGIGWAGSPWVNTSTLIDGKCVGFVQGTGCISNVFTAPVSGPCVISFLAGARPGYPATYVSVKIDGATVRTIPPHAFTNTLGGTFSVSAFVEAGTHTLAFQAAEVSPDVDCATWLDRIGITFLNHGGLSDVLPPGTEMSVAAGAVLDLGGNAQTLAGLAGGGLVTNGTLAVNGVIAPGGANAPGTLTVPPGAALSGTLLVDVMTDGTCDTLAASGTLDVSGLALRIQDTALLNTQARYLVARCAPGGLMGRFVSTNLAGLWRVAYHADAGEAWVELTRGTQLLIR